LKRKIENAIFNSQKKDPAKIRKAEYAEALRQDIKAWLDPISTAHKAGNPKSYKECKDAIILFVKDHPTSRMLTSEYDELDGHLLGLFPAILSDSYLLIVRAINDKYFIELTDILEDSKPRFTSQDVQVNLISE